MKSKDEIRDEAALWAVRTGDPSFDEWALFTAWLEADAANAEAYDRAVVAADEAAALLSSAHDRPDTAPEPANDDDAAPPIARNRRWIGTAIAASLAGLAAFGAWQFANDDRQFDTEAGETMRVALEDGSHIDLAGQSSLIVDGSDPRRAKLLEGQAIFTIRHDETHPFRLTAGNDTIVDAGTVFDVRLGDDQLDVEVAEGAVVINPEKRNLFIAAGNRVTRQGQNYAVAAIAPDQVGEWKMGRITFRDAGLAEIADRLTDATGIAFEPKGTTRISVSGSVLVAPIAADPASLGPVLGLSVEQSADGWSLAAE